MFVEEALYGMLYLVMLFNDKVSCFLYLYLYLRAVSGIVPVCTFRWCLMFMAWLLAKCLVYL